MGNALNVDIPPGAKVVIKQEYFTKPQPESARTVIVDSEGNDKMGAGFGCCNSTSGQAIFGKWADTGEVCRVEGYQLEKMLPPDEEDCEAKRRDGIELVKLGITE